MDRHGKYLLSSEKASEHFGLQTDDIVGKSLFDLLANEVAQEYFEKNALLIDFGGSREYEDTIVLNGKKKTKAVTWEWDVQTGETSFNKRWAQIIGYTPLRKFLLSVLKKGEDTYTMYA